MVDILLCPHRFYTTTRFLVCNRRCGAKLAHPVRDGVTFGYLPVSSNIEMLPKESLCGGNRIVMFDVHFHCEHTRSGRLLNIEVVRANEGEEKRGMKHRHYEKAGGGGDPRGTISTCEDLGATPPGIEPGGRRIFKHQSGRGGVVVRQHDPPPQLGGVSSGFSPVGIVPDGAAGLAGFLGVLPFPPPFHSGASPYSPRFTLIGSRDLDVRSHQNIFTRLLQTSSKHHQAPAKKGKEVEGGGGEVVHVLGQKQGRWRRVIAAARPTQHPVSGQGRLFGRGRRHLHVGACWRPFASPGVTTITRLTHRGWGGGGGYTMNIDGDMVTVLFACPVMDCRANHGTRTHSPPPPLTPPPYHPQKLARFQPVKTPLSLPNPLPVIPPGQPSRWGSGAKVMTSLAPRVIAPVAKAFLLMSLEKLVQREESHVAGSHGKTVPRRAPPLRSFNDSRGVPCRGLAAPEDASLLSSRRSGRWRGVITEITSGAQLPARECFTTLPCADNGAPWVQDSLAGAVNLPASHQGDPVSTPGRVTPDFRVWESYRAMPLVGGFSRGSPVFPALSFRCCSILILITLIGSNDLDWPGHGIFRMWRSCRTMPLVGEFSRGSSVPPPPPISFRSCPILTQSPSSALKTSLLRAAQISSLTRENSAEPARSGEWRSYSTRQCNPYRSRTSRAGKGEERRRQTGPLRRIPTYHLGFIDFSPKLLFQ
ncbi:hypothetical protein PR048_014569 [Dryococelus australis]|uniref:Uncharacterized protein n=1 Tax=Dryococelus australis TaxID=614101 RepID=A0ABQ9HF06_9NEOP|nr:hypothetical protein PR048_014569 [Dryococelus australis]